MSPAQRKLLVWSVRILILLSVVVGVSRTFEGAVSRLADQSWQLHPTWLALSGALYIAGMGAMCVFWHFALAALGQRVPWPITLYAYYLGHLGKYVPGKALVIVLRVAVIRGRIRSTWLAVVSVFLESLTMMAVGACLGAALAAKFIATQPLWTALAAACAVAAFTPTLPPIARKLARIGLRRFRSPLAEPSSNTSNDSPVDEAVHQITWRLWLYGCLAGTACWILLGLSLWATLRGIGVEIIQPIADGPLLIGIVSLAVVAGFLSFLPGGLVVRDAVLMQTLAPICGEANALVAALLLRLAWLVAELVTCGILYVATYRARK